MALVYSHANADARAELYDPAHPAPLVCHQWRRQTPTLFLCARCALQYAANCGSGHGVRV